MYSKYILIIKMDMLDKQRLHFDAIQNIDLVKKYKILEYESKGNKMYFSYILNYIKDVIKILEGEIDFINIIFGNLMDFENKLINSISIYNTIIFISKINKFNNILNEFNIKNIDISKIIKSNTIFAQIINQDNREIFDIKFYNNFNTYFNIINDIIDIITDISEPTREIRDMYIESNDKYIEMFKFVNSFNINDNFSSDDKKLLYKIQYDNYDNFAYDNYDKMKKKYNDIITCYMTMIDKKIQYINQ
jgi:hypothetical protein